MSFIIKHSRILTGVVIGAVAGFIYYRLVGCESGSCMITAHPVNSTLYGAMMGGLLVSSFKKSNQNHNNKNNEQ